MDSFKELTAPASNAAKRLLDCIFEREIDGELVRVRIVETEAYDQTDAASHSYKGRSQRTDIMFGPAGYLYVYFTYGMHYCANVVVGEAGYGAAVLIRAVEPLGNEGLLERRRGGKSGIELTNGPAKLCQALGINKQLNGHNLREAPLRLVLAPQLSSEAIVTTRRVGISQAKDVLWRFYVKDNSFVSVK
ncbi:MAG TPA: DNA-3-methyladenine glycosylase [Candidatus Saccharimonadales bacterium]|nr:DNA-3-methyladenine glycosylase [Candidatus Saccharimonadales bacterium]